MLGTRDFFDLDGHRALAVLLRHRDFALAIFFANIELLLRLNARLLALQTLFFLHLLGLGLLTRLNGRDLALLARFGIGLLACQSEHGFLGFHVLLGDCEVGIALELVGHDVLVRGQLGDLANTFGVQNIVRVEGRLRGLLQIVNRHVFQHITIQVIADHMNDLVAEILAVFEQLHKLDLLAHRLQTFGELGVEQLVHGTLFRRTLHANRLGHLEHVFRRFIHAQIEGHGDVGTHVVLADQTFLAASIDLQRDQRDLHEFLLVNHRQHQAAGELHLGLRGRVVDDQRRALRHLDVEGLDERKQAHDDNEDRDDDDRGNDVPLREVQAHGFSPSGSQKE